jgi:hypothetical protein
MWPGPLLRMGKYMSFFDVPDPHLRPLCAVFDQPPRLADAQDRPHAPHHPRQEGYRRHPRGVFLDRVLEHIEVGEGARDVVAVISSSFLSLSMHETEMFPDRVYVGPPTVPVVLDDGEGQVCKVSDGRGTAVVASDRN